MSPAQAPLIPQASLTSTSSSVVSPFEFGKSRVISMYPTDEPDAPILGLQLTVEETTELIDRFKAYTGLNIFVDTTLESTVMYLTQRLVCMPFFCSLSLALSSLSEVLSILGL